MRLYAQKGKASPQTSAARVERSRPTPPHFCAAARAVLSAKGFADSNYHATGAQTLYRRAVNLEPAVAPSIVDDVLRGPSRPIPAPVRDEMESKLGHDFTDVRIHTDSRAGASANAVAAEAYTVARHIVFSPGRFDPGSLQGRQLLAHELVHTMSRPEGTPTPSARLRISSPAEAAERHAVTVSTGVTALIPPTAAQPTLFRAPPPAPVPLTAVAMNHDKVTVPPVAGLALSVSLTPANATGVSFALVGDNATLAAGTTINTSTGDVTVAPTQTGGSAHAEASQTLTQPDGSTVTTTRSAPFNFTAIPAGISSTSAIDTSAAGMYGGEFTHTFSAPGGTQSELELTHVNERFAAATGTTLNLTGQLGNLSITVNDPDAASAGWDLDSAGEMAGPDHVTWADTFSARPFVANASNPTPAHTLPQELAATQDFRNLTFPAQTYGAAVASTTHRRAFEERSDLIRAVTSANAAGINEELEQDYAGPTVFRRCTASPSSIPAATPAPPGGTAPAPTTSTITVDMEGQTGTPTFSIQGPSLGCTIDAAGVLTPGTTPGTVTVRAGDNSNFDETAVTVTAPPPAPSP